MTTLIWNIESGESPAGYRIDALNPTTFEEVAYLDVLAPITSAYFDLLELPKGVGYVIQVRAYVMDGTDRVYSPASNKIYLREAV